MTNTEEMVDAPDWLADWREWLEDDLFQQVHGLVRQRDVFRSWNALVEAAAPESKTNGLFHQWVNHNYVTSVSVGVRRMCDAKGRTRSLVRLLGEIKANASELTREWWIGRWHPPTDNPTAAYLESFDRLSSGGDHVDPEIVNDDLDRLGDVCCTVKRYVDKHVAHVDADRFTVKPVTLGEVHTAVDVVYEVFHRWYQLVTNAGLATPFAEPWEHIFTVPWIGQPDASAIFASRQAESEELEEHLGTQR